MDIYSSKIPRLFGPAPWAITIGCITFYTEPESSVSAKWKAHEDCHKRQWRDGWYIGFLVMYIWYQIRCGYDHNPYEIEARQYAEFMS